MAKAKTRRKALRISADAASELRWLAQASKAPRLRSMREFAEQEVVLPNGPYEGLRYKCEYQPYSGLYFDAIDSGNWRRSIATGPTQSGKTLTTWVIPIMYHLFEVRETVIAGIPDLDMARDKWAEDIEPVIATSRFADLMPKRGPGSKGGVSSAVRFAHGPTLRFMSGGSRDAGRSAFTSRVICITETDSMDEASKSSRESDKISQLEGRTRAYDDRSMAYMECTVTVDYGRTWHEWSEGTASQIVSRCVHCQKWAQIEREHLVGWKQAQSVEEARQIARWICNRCKATINESERAAMVGGARLLHAGQDITGESKIVGAPRPTDTLGFRWSAFNNLFAKGSTIAADEWRASRSPDQDAAERKMCQQVWCLPHQPDEDPEEDISAESIERRSVPAMRGRIPKWADRLVVSIDLGKYYCYWMAVAWRLDAVGLIAEYGKLPVLDGQNIERSLLLTLRSFKASVLDAGWPIEGGGGIKLPDAVIIDSGWKPTAPYSFVQEAGVGYWPAKGHGATQEAKYYRAPKRTSSVVVKIGEAYHIARLREGGFRIKLVEVNADYWKSWLHSRLSASTSSPGSLALTAMHSRGEHAELAKHLAAEQEVRVYKPGRGEQRVWKQTNRDNHWLDCAYLACCAGHIAGVRLLPDNQTSPQVSAEQEKTEWFKTQRNAKERRIRRP